MWRFRDAAGDHEIQVDGSLRANNADALHIAALAGVGITVLPVFMVGPDIRRGALEVIFPHVQFSQTSLDSSIYAVFPYGRHLSPKVRAFVDFLLSPEVQTDIPLNMFVYPVVTGIELPILGGTAG